MARKTTARRKGVPVWVWVACAGGLLFVGFTGLLVATAIANAGKPSREEQKIASLPTREELDEKLVGKSEDDVLKVLGKPESTSRTMWVYGDVARDRITGNACSVYVHFDGDRVSAVR